jgi:diguanylate cyclase
LGLKKATQPAQPMNQADIIVQTKKGLGFVRAVYVPRIIGFGTLSLGIAGALHQRGAPAWLYALDALFGFVWPHLAYFLSSRREKPVPAEYRNLRIDALFCGFWAVAMGLNPLPTGLMVTVLLMDNAMVGGLLLLGQSLAGLLAGALIAAVVLRGVPLCLHTGLIARWACAPFVVIYPVTIGVLSFRNGLKVNREKRLLRQFSQQDSLSGTYSRIYWERRADEELQRCKRYQRTASLILLDIDHFKIINDNFGHMTGDDVIRGLGLILQEQVRAGDIPARLGGDEFGILLPEATSIEAAAVVRRIQSALAQKKWGNSGAGFAVTLSFGIAEFFETAASLDDWLHRADDALYRAKRSGRNAFEMSRPEADILTPSFPRKRESSS